MLKEEKELRRLLNPIVSLEGVSYRKEIVPAITALVRAVREDERKVMQDPKNWPDWRRGEGGVMTRKTGWVVRIALVKRPEGTDRAFVNCNVSLLVTEIFRYGGVVSVVKEDERTLVFDFIAFADKGTQAWAQMQADRIKSFGINAVAAPKYV